MRRGIFAEISIMTPGAMTWLLGWEGERYLSEDVDHDAWSDDLLSFRVGLGREWGTFSKISVMTPGAMNCSAGVGRGEIPLLRN